METFVPIIVAIITGGISLTGTIITVLSVTRKQSQELAVSLAIMSTRLDDLSKQVEKHNNFAERLPKLEAEIDAMRSEIRDLKGAKPA